MGGVGEDRQARGHLLMSDAPQWCGWVAAQDFSLFAQVGQELVFRKRICSFLTTTLVFHVRAMDDEVRHQG